MGNGESSYRRYLDGEKEAFSDIVKLYRAGLTFFIEGLVHDPYAAEDIAIDVFMQLIIHKRRYNFKTPLKTYLYMIARSRSIDWLRHKKRLREEELSEIEGGGFEDDILADEQKRAVHRAIARLSEEMRTAVHLVYFEGMSYDEAAQVMKKNRKQVDNLLYRAKKELRGILGSEALL